MSHAKGWIDAATKEGKKVAAMASTSMETRTVPFEPRNVVCLHDESMQSESAKNTRHAAVEVSSFDSKTKRSKLLSMQNKLLMVCNQLPLSFVPSIGVPTRQFWRPVLRTVPLTFRCGLAGPVAVLLVRAASLSCLLQVRRVPIRP
jgi:hypothetical protein